MSSRLTQQSVSEEPASSAVTQEALSTESISCDLQRADIILTHGGSPIGRAIQLFTKSYWNHVSVVFVLSDKASGTKNGYRSTFVLEAEPGGIDVHPIDRYLFAESRDMAVLRFPANSLPSEIRDDFLRRVRGFAFEEIDAAYGFGTIFRTAANIIGFPPLLRAFRAVRFLVSPNKRQSMNSFICSGVVQYAYLRAMYGESTTDALFYDEFFQDPAHRKGLVVRQDERSAYDPSMEFSALDHRLRSTTPADFAQAAIGGTLDCVGERVGGEWKATVRP